MPILTRTGMSGSENRGIETRLPIARVNKQGLVRKRRPKGEPTVFMGIRVNSVNKAHFFQACKGLNLLGGEVLDSFMAEFWQKYTGEKGNIREEHEALQREANRLYD